MKHIYMTHILLFLTLIQFTNVASKPPNFLKILI